MALFTCLFFERAFCRRRVAFQAWRFEVLTGSGTSNGSEGYSIASVLDVDMDRWIAGGSAFLGIATRVSATLPCLDQ